MVNLWKSLVIVGGIYLFFLLEYIMKMIVRFKEKSASENKDTEVSRQIRSSFMLTVKEFSKYPGERRFLIAACQNKQLNARSQ